jgi:hypothetical protein
VTVAGVYAMVRAPLVAGRLVVGQRTAAPLGRGPLEQPLVPAAIVVSTAVVPPPRPKQNAGTTRERVTRAKQPAQHRQPTQGRQTTPPRAVAQRYAQTWVVLPTASTVMPATAESAGRMSIEATSRDWQHHWAVRAAVIALPPEARGARLIGGVCCASTVQMALGQRGRMDLGGQQRRAQGTVTDRVSWFWGGQRLFDAPGDAWSGWLAQQGESLVELGAATPAPPGPAPAFAEGA